MPWRLALSLETLRNELNAAWPDRDKRSDGAIGDAAHASTGSASDHNPWVIGSDGIGVVRAYDVDTDLDGTDDSNDPEMGALAEQLRQLGIGGDERLTGGGYLIFDGRIASERDGWAWRPYVGDAHISHLHVSVSRSGATASVPSPTSNPATFDSTAPWLIAAPDTGDDFDMTPQELREQLDAAIQAACREPVPGQEDPAPGTSAATGYIAALVKRKIAEAYGQNVDHPIAAAGEDVVRSIKGQGDPGDLTISEVLSKL